MSAKSPERRSHYTQDVVKTRDEDRDYKRGKGNNDDYKPRERYHDRRRDADREQESLRRDGERRGDRRDYRDDRRSDRRDYDDRRRERDREPERDRERGRDNSRERAGPSRRSASPTRPSSERRSARPRSGSRSRPASPVDKAKPNFKPSGLLAAATNTVKAADGTSTVLKYNEPPEARKPVLGWRLYVFKGSDQIELLHIHRQSAYLIGRDRAVVDIFIEHPSCSKQHAAIQHRQVQEKDEFGARNRTFIIDLESTNGTHVNDEAIPTTRFYELRAGDVIKFGLSNREYVLLHDEAT
ncbi:smad nuclear interacting protein 1 [Melanogaster broomeanus]|nr:smad nuclear interacting protein 1 [Melanogaster broomeanus]